MVEGIFKAKQNLVFCLKSEKYEDTELIRNGSLEPY